MSLCYVYDDISCLVILAYPGEQSVHRDDFGVEAFIEALDDYQLELYVRSQNPKDLDVALKHASIMESFTSTRGKRTEAEQFNASEKPDKQPVDKYGGRVRYVTKEGDVQSTEALVRQVDDRIQGVKKAKLTPTQYFPTSILSQAYPGLNYQANPFCPSPYGDLTAPQVVFQVAGTPQVGYCPANAPQSSPASAPQASTTNQRIVSKVPTNNTLPTIKVYDASRRGWTCNSKQHFDSKCTSKVSKIANTSQSSNNNSKPDLNDPNEPCRYCQK